MNLTSTKANYVIKLKLHKRLRMRLSMLQQAKNVIF